MVVVDNKLLNIQLPGTAGGHLTDKYDEHVTLPIAMGKIVKADN
ncbi:hypothetical protein [Lacticaseibacillus zhaodongensis]|nr:hypothetical protein [Lacticaseibacillus zhaodongensis]